jgi:mRNA interferase RelE/StbE
LRAASRNLPTILAQADARKLRGGANEWRIRIGDYRVVYTIEDNTKTVDVTRIAHRKEAYK